MEGMIGNIPWGIGYISEKFGLISLDDGYVGLRCTSPVMTLKTTTVPLTLMSYAVHLHLSPTPPYTLRVNP
jgi:hypothetical protein